MQIFKKKQHVIISYLVITLGILIYTFGWAAVMLPAKIVGGGVSGISSVLYYALGLHIPIGVMNLVINAVLVLIGFKVLGSKFGANTIYGIVMSSLCFILWQQVLHVETLFDVSQFGGFMCAIIGGALCGGGIGMTFAMGGNSGGTDIIALILSKFYNISPGKVIMYLDIFIIGSSFFVSHKLENVVFGYIVLMCWIWCWTATSSRTRYWSSRRRTKRLARPSPTRWDAVPHCWMPKAATATRS